MPLCTPTLVGPISEWSSTLLVRGSVHGSTVTVRSIGPTPRDIAKATNVGGGEDRLDLLPGVKLRADDLLVVKQEGAAGVSKETAAKLAFPVGLVPTSYTHTEALSFVSHVYECGQALWIGGAVPGASVTVTHGGATIGHGVATEDRARFALTTSTPSAPATLHVSQAAPAGFPALSGSPMVTAAAVDHLPTLLPAPKFTGDHPPRGCDASVELGHVIDGALVTIKHSGGAADDVALFDVSDLNFLLAKPLPQAGETLHITQTVAAHCEKKPSLHLDLHVGASQRPPAPSVPPLCPGVIQIPVSNLVPGATVTFTIDGAPFIGTAPADKTSATFEVPPIPASATTITVTQQNTCMQLSDPTTVTVKPFGPSKPKLVEPLFECARVVRVDGTQPGAYLQVFAKTGSDPKRPISPRITASVKSTRIAVTPYLVKHDAVWVEQLACSGDWKPTAHVTVKADPASKLEIPSPVEGDDFVDVVAVPGSHVDVFTQPQGAATPHFLGGGDVDPEVQRIQLSRALVASDRLTAIQTLCTSTVRTERPATVLPATMTFTMPAPQVRDSTTNAHKPLVWHTGTLVCHHKGSWTFTAFFENQETDADVDFTFGVSLAFVDSSGKAFGVTRDAQLSAAGSGEVTMIGYRTLGIPPSQTFTIVDTYNPFKDPKNWAGVLGTTATFDLPAELVIWNTYAGTGDEPDGGDD